ncbi:hypothetical protein [Marinobacter shengliensis]|uniref:hypothetical protein n=1 Tax=Marinobacter shengliensis TaxID=1389223 RepID=UPI001108CE8F|nr:hypothetical protein [Marinobacter shengliensis]
MADTESYVSHSRPKKIFFGLPGAALFPILAIIPLALTVGIIGPIAMLVWVAFLKYSDSRGYSFFGYYGRKLRRYAGGYTARSRRFYNIDF